MSQPLLSDKEFAKLFNQIGPVALAKLIGVSERSVYERQRSVEWRTGINIIPANPKYIEKNEHPYRLDVKVKDGVVIVGSDVHYWPGEPSVAHRAFVSFIKKMKPIAVIQNGDVMDFPRVSRHPPIGWEGQPEVHEEVEFAQDRMHEIAEAAGKARKIWTLGNHDCSSSDSECLTKRGWVSHEKIRRDDQVLSLNNDGISLWSPINEILVYPFDGELVELNNRTASMAVTKNHRILFRGYGTGGRCLEYATYDDLPCRIEIPTGAESITAEKKDFKLIPYKGDVWCLRVPHGNFMVRRNGCAFFTGNSRYETRLATVAPEYAKIHGVHLSDHFPLWEPCWSVWINDNVVVKHRFKGGIHATHNNTMWSGKTTITGHLHSLKVTPFTDYNGTRYGVDTGCLADTSGKQFVDYTEDGPLNWRSGFVILSFAGGRLVHPELAMVSEHEKGHVEFRGQLWKI